jgi:hypothetical protein
MFIPLEPTYFIEVQGSLDEDIEASVGRALLIAKEQSIPVTFKHLGISLDVDPEDDVQKIVSKWEEEKDGIKPEYLEHFMIMNQPSEPLTRFVFLPGMGCYVDRAVQQAILIHNEGIHKQTNVPFYLRFSGKDIEIKKGDNLEIVLERRRTEVEKYVAKFEQTARGRQLAEKMQQITTEASLARVANQARNENSRYKFPDSPIFFDNSTIEQQFRDLIIGGMEQLDLDPHTSEEKMMEIFDAICPNESQKMYDDALEQIQLARKKGFSSYLEIKTLERMFLNGEKPGDSNTQSQ